MVARAESCLYFYRFDALAETDVDDDYGVVWMQSTIDPLPGWCVMLARAAVRVPEGATGHATAPLEPVRTARTRRVTVALDVAAAGSALTPGRIAQDLDLHRGLLSPAVTRDGLRLEWRGRTSGTVGLVGGIEIGMPVLDPPRRLAAGLTRVGVASCASASV